MTTRLDDDLRERWTRPEDGQASLDRALRELEHRLTEDDGTPVPRSHVGRAHQRLSEAYRLSGSMQQALVHKDAALEVWHAQGKVRAAFLVRLQKALVLAELGDPAAHVLMAELGSELRGDSDLEPHYLDFWLEYDARRLFWTGDRVEAERQLVAALEFRREHRAIRIVEWTEHALIKVRCAGESV